MEVPSTGSVGNNSEKMKGPLKQDRLNNCVKISISFSNFFKKHEYKIIHWSSRYYTTEIIDQNTQPLEVIKHNILVLKSSEYVIIPSLAFLGVLYLGEKVNGHHFTLIFDWRVQHETIYMVMQKCCVWNKTFLLGPISFKHNVACTED